jgi:hypothetical protein
MNLKPVSVSVKVAGGGGSGGAVAASPSTGLGTAGMYGIPTAAPPTGRYALTVTISPTPIRSDDGNDLQLIADRMIGAEARVRLIDGREFVVSKVDGTRVGSVG